MKKTKSLLYSLLFLMIFPSLLSAQLQRERVVTDQPVELIFLAPRNINLYTVEPLSKGELHYSIMHTFGEVRSGVRNLWGIDRGANVRFSLEYGFSDRLSMGVGRSSMDKVYDFSARYLLIRQMRGDGSPVAIALIPSLGITTGSFGFLAQDYTFSDRLNFNIAVPIARKFSDKLSLQMVPMITHFNRTGFELNVADQNVQTYYSVGVGGRYMIAPRTAFTFQYVPPITDAEGLDHNIGIGIDLDTGGHVFQIFFTTSRALNESYLVSSTNGDFLDGGYRFGFNINRLFKLRDG